MLWSWHIEEHTMFDINFFAAMYYTAFMYKIDLVPFEIYIDKISSSMKSLPSLFLMLFDEFSSTQNSLSHRRIVLYWEFIEWKLPSPPLLLPLNVSITIMLVCEIIIFPPTMLILMKRKFQCDSFWLMIY